MNGCSGCLFCSEKHGYGFCDIKHFFVEDESPDYVCDNFIINGTTAQIEDDYCKLIKNREEKGEAL